MVSMLCLALADLAVAVLLDAGCCCSRTSLGSESVMWL